MFGRAVALVERPRQRRAAEGVKRCADFVGRGLDRAGFVNRRDGGIALHRIQAQEGGAAFLDFTRSAPAATSRSMPNSVRARPRRQRRPIAFDSFNVAGVGKDWGFVRGDAPPQCGVRAGPEISASAAITS